MTYPMSLLLSLGKYDYFESLLSHMNALPWGKYKQKYLLTLCTVFSVEKEIQHRRN